MRTNSNGDVTGEAEENKKSGLFLSQKNNAIAKDKNCSPIAYTFMFFVQQNHALKCPSAEKKLSKYLMESTSLAQYLLTVRYRAAN